MWEPLTEPQLQLLYQKLGASEQSLRRDVAAIRSWLDKQPHLPTLSEATMDVDGWVRAYLLRCKNSVERTKQAIDMLFTGRTNIPEFFSDRDPADPAVQNAFEMIQMSIMPRPTPGGYRVHVYAFAPEEDKEIGIQAQLKRALMQQELVLRDDTSMGDIVVADLGNFKIGRVRELGLMLPVLSKYLKSALKMYPMSLKCMHIVNLMPSHSSAVLALWNQISWKKLHQRVIVHSDVAELRGHLPPECLPSDLGGSGPSMHEGNEKWKRKLEENQAWFRTQDLLKSDESKRIGTSKFAEEFSLGVPGSFRSLQVD